jgi:alkyl sulfatase BDS1-like metallo-beta-lactamase superfamily hydrolase
MYRFLHDQALRQANHGLKPREIAEVTKIPESLAKNWHSRGYYGYYVHNLASQYVLRLGPFTGNPEELNQLPPSESGKRFVKYAGGAANVIKMAQEEYNAGDYRGAAEALNHLTYSDPNNQVARNLLADTYDQLAYQAESAIWRNFYLTGADELRRGMLTPPVPSSLTPDVIKAQPLDMFFDYLGVRLNADKAGANKVDMIFDLTDTKEKYEVGVENGALHYTELGTLRRRDGIVLRRRAVTNPDVIFTTTREAFNDVMQGTKTYGQLVSDGKATIGGANPGKLDQFNSWMDTFNVWFDIVRPAQGYLNATGSATTGVSQVTTGTVQPTGPPSRGSKNLVKVVGSLFIGGMAVWAFI